jgi:hypothetical protein
MKKRLFKCLLLLQLALLPALHGLSQNSGANCLNAIPLPNNNTCLTNQQTASSELWYSFVASQYNEQIVLTNSPDTNFAHIHTLEIYSDACSSLNFIQSAPVNSSNVITLNAAQLTIGNTYYVKAVRELPGLCRACDKQTTNFEICATSLNWIVFMNITWPGGNCLQSIGNYCNITVCVGDLVCFDLDPANQAQGGTATWTINGTNCPTVQTLPANGQTCCTFSTVGTYTVQVSQLTAPPVEYGLSHEATITVVNPINVNFTYNPVPSCLGDQINFAYTGFTGSEPYIAWDFGDGNTANCTGFGCPGFTSNIYQAPGTYTVSLCVFNGSCDTVCTSQEITIQPPSAGFTYSGTCRIKFVADTLCVHGLISETWDFGDGSPVYAGSNPVHVFPLNNYGYVVIHTITTPYGTFTYSQTVIQPGGPQANIVGSAVNTCGSSTLPYTASPCAPGIVYSWTAVGGTPASSTGCTTNINWTNAAGGTLYLTAFDPVNDCYGYDTILIPPCCDTLDEANKLIFTNLSATDIYQQFAGNFQNGNFVFPGNIVINTLFTVDTNITFENCPLIQMGPNVRIDILAGQTLTLSKCTTQVKCGYMWDGIYIKGNTARLNVYNNSVIQQAVNGIVSEIGGVFDIRNTKLDNNYKDIRIKAYGNTHQGNVRATSFLMTGSFLPAVPALPFGHDKTVIGIEIEDNKQVQIGDASQVNFRNYFTGIMVGIKSSNSGLTVHNARFLNFYPTPLEALFIPNAGTGILAIGRKNLNYQPYLNVGGTGTNQLCLFEKMRVGIDASNYLEMNITKNTISEFSIYGIRVKDDNRRFITIQDNTLTNQTVNYAFVTAVQILEVPYSTININRNKILQSPVQSQQIGTGIQVACVSPSDVTLNVTNNSVITRVQTGIWLQNLIGKRKVFVNSNNISFTKPNNAYSTAHYGIRLEGCATVSCDTNTVAKGGANPNGAMVQNLRGLSIENSPATTASDNVFIRMGSGILGYDISSSSTLACNTFNRCYHGVYFTGSVFTGGTCDIGDQIYDPNGVPSATGNTWTANVANYWINGFVDPNNPIVWRWDLIQPINGALQVTCNPFTQTSYNACSVFFLAPQVVQRDKMVGAMLRTANNPNAPVDQQYQLRRHAYRTLNQNPQWLNLNSPDDTLYQNFYTAYSTQNIGLLRTIEVAADSGDFTAVNANCNAINCSNMQEHNFKLVYEIYSRTWMQAVQSFTPADSATLMNIATQEPVAGGRAVYSARILLDYPVDYYGANSQRIGAEQEEEYSSASAVIYPNPAADYFTLEYGVDEGENATVELIDLTGKTVKTVALTPLADTYQINTADLQAGIYLIRINVNGEMQVQNRVTIVK